MTEYYIPSDISEAEFTEKRSRFIGQVCPVDTEEDARAFIESVKKEHHDARHNCWCYLLREGNIVRYSDDGEPQGTAGQPMLEVFQREGITNLVCVVTRYFGGILLGTGGLARAYTRGAKDALIAAGVSVVRKWMVETVSCPYNRFEVIRREILSCGGIITDTEYGEGIVLSVLIPEEQQQVFEKNLTEISSGTIAPVVVGESHRAVRIK